MSDDQALYEAGRMDALYKHRFEIRAFHGYNGDLSKVEAGDVQRLLDALWNEIGPDYDNQKRIEAYALYDRLTEGGGDGI